MKALVAYSPTEYKFEPQYPVPALGPDDILLKTEGCGVCAGDVKCSHGADMFWGDGDAQPEWVDPPFIPGHEFIGRIAFVGENLKDKYTVGQRVATEQIAPCGECRFCLDGHYWMCQPHNIYGFQKDCNGGMAEYVLLHEKNAKIHPIPDNMPLHEALLIEPYGCSKHAVDRGSITNEDVVVISGAGTLGLGMITYTRMKNPKKLIVLDMVEERLAKAKEFGADLVINPAKTDVVEEIMNLTDGYGCDVYIEATGFPASVVQGLKMIRKLGRFVEFSVFADPTTVDWSIIGDRKELDLLGAHLSPYCFPFVIENIDNGNLKTDGVVTKIFELEDWEDAFSYAAGKPGHFKVAFKFD